VCVDLSGFIKELPLYAIVVLNIANYLFFKQNCIFVICEKFLSI